MTGSQIAKAQKLSSNFDNQKHNDSIENKSKPKIRSSGTGFFVTQNGHILTCNHVIEKANLIKIKIGEEIYNAEIINENSFIDLALLKIEKSSPAIKFSSSEIVLGEEAFTIGFPNPFLQGFSSKFTKGVISSISGIQDDPRFLKMSAPIQPSTTFH